MRYGASQRARRIKFEGLQLFPDHNELEARRWPCVFLSFAILPKTLHAKPYEPKAGVKRSNSGSPPLKSYAAVEIEDSSRSTVSSLYSTCKILKRISVVENL